MARGFFGKGKGSEQLAKDLSHEVGNSLEISIIFRLVLLMLTRLRAEEHTAPRMRRRCKYGSLIAIICITCDSRIIALLVSEWRQGGGAQSGKPVRAWCGGSDDHWQG